MRCGIMLSTKLSKLRSSYQSLSSLASAKAMASILCSGLTLDQSSLMNTLNKGPCSEHSRESDPNNAITILQYAFNIRKYSSNRQD
jgi:hypothetical protein